MFRWATTKGYIALIPPNSRNVDYNIDSLCSPLDAGGYSISSSSLLSRLTTCCAETMAELEELDEGLKSSWAPSVEDDD